MAQARSSVPIDLPDIPVSGTRPAAMPAAHTLHGMNKAVGHGTAPPEGLNVDAAGMAAKTACHLDIVPGTQITDPDAIAPLGKTDDVAISFHFGMLGADRGRRPAAVSAWLG